jgi:hypothetical protein
VAWKNKANVCFLPATLSQEKGVVAEGIEGSQEYYLGHQKRESGTFFLLPSCNTLS